MFTVWSLSTEGITLDRSHDPLFKLLLSVENSRQWATTTSAAMNHFSNYYSRLKIPDSEQPQHRRWWTTFQTTTLGWEFQTVSNHNIGGDEPLFKLIPSVSHAPLFKLLPLVDILQTMNSQKIADRHIFHELHDTIYKLLPPLDRRQTVSTQKISGGHTVKEVSCWRCYKRSEISIGIDK